MALNGFLRLRGSGGRLGTACFSSVALCALLLCAPSASAQGFKWWQSDTYRRELGLTADQSRRLEDTFQAALPSLRSQKRVLDLAEAEFERLIERGDDTTVMDQVGRVEVARAELNKTRALMLLRMRRTLTTDQWLKFGALHQAEEAERRAAQGRGHKGPDSGAPKKVPENRGQASSGRDGRAK
jgi:Spy/CpxP family protein refolding chaperone